MNVVLVIIDSLRMDHVGALGNRWIETPNMDRLAGESLVFERALPESIPTINARRAIHTGTRSWPFKDWVIPKGEDIRLQGWQPIPESQTTLAQVLKEHGYRSMLVTDTMHQFKPSYNMHEGFDAFDFIRGQTTDNYQPNWTYPTKKVEQALLKGNVEAMRAQMQQYWANMAGTNLGPPASEEDYMAPRVFSRASEYLRLASAGGGPFFMVVDSYDPHEPWDTPEEYVKMYDDEPYGGKEPFSVIYGPSDYLTERELTRMKARYAGEVTMVDRWLGRFLDTMGELGLFEALREAGELENTYVFFTSDNGFHLGQHRLSAGKWTAYEEDIRVPLVVRGPGVPEGERLPHVVLNNDLAPTFADLAGAEAPGFVDGRSLRPLLDGSPTPEEGWRQRFLIEAVAERAPTPRSSFLNESEVRPLVTGDPLPQDWRRTSATKARSSEEWGRPWFKALRTEDYLYVEYKTDERELYDLGKDPHQLNNEYGSAPPELILRLEAKLDALRQCSAQDCRAAEGGEG